ncbi:glycosyltransferase family 2 protein [Sphingobacterium sp. HJSM2_6]|uniref:glycosyltransferase family 2 protein n=1 Tax=Sphingobacterium sp. HJSM2_6 TaxID=3366264 RepID=UPI003BDC713B
MKLERERFKKIKRKLLKRNDIYFEYVTPALLDLIILSNAKNKKLHECTQTAINTAILGSSGIYINIIVLEQAESVQYNYCQTIRMKGEFNYNKYSNYGASLGKAKWIMIANNDLIFANNWLVELLKPNYDVVSPHEPRFHLQSSIKRDTKGVINGKHFSGWCFMISRVVWSKIGGFDEEFKFWFADNSAIEQFVNIGIIPMVVKKSIVYHLVNTTLKTLNEEQINSNTWELVEKFNFKYNRDIFCNDPRYLEWKKMNL